MFLFCHNAIGRQSKSFFLFVALVDFDSTSKVSILIPPRRAHLSTFSSFVPQVSTAVIVVCSLVRFQQRPRPFRTHLGWSPDRRSLISRYMTGSSSSIAKWNISGEKNGISPRYSILYPGMDRLLRCRSSLLVSLTLLSCAAGMEGILTGILVFPSVYLSIRRVK